MEMETGKIQQIPEGQKAPEGMIQLSDYEQKVLETLPEKHRMFRLGWLRFFRDRKVDTMTKIKMKQAFEAGWNSATFFKSTYINDEGF